MSRFDETHICPHCLEPQNADTIICDVCNINVHLTPEESRRERPTFIDEGYNSLKHATRCIPKEDLSHFLILDSTYLF